MLLILRCIMLMWSSGLLYHVVFQVVINISKEYITFIFRIKGLMLKMELICSSKMIVTTTTCHHNPGKPKNKMCTLASNSKEMKFYGSS